MISHSVIFGVTDGGWKGMGGGWAAAGDLQSKDNTAGAIRSARVADQCPTAKAWQRCVPWAWARPSPRSGPPPVQTVALHVHSFPNDACGRGPPGGAPHPPRRLDRRGARRSIPRGQPVPVAATETRRASVCGAGHAKRHMGTAPGTFVTGPPLRTRPTKGKGVPPPTHTHTHTHTNARSGRPALHLPDTAVIELDFGVPYLPRDFKKIRFAPKNK